MICSDCKLELPEDPCETCGQATPPEARMLVDLIKERDELRLEIAAFRGLPEGGILGWESCLMNTRRSWSREFHKEAFTYHLIVDIDLSGNVFDARIEEFDNSGHRRVWQWKYEPWTPRQAMRAVDRAAKDLGIPDLLCEVRQNDDDCGRRAVAYLARPGLRPLLTCTAHRGTG